MANTVIITSGEKQFKRLEAPLRSASLRVLRLLRKKNAVVDIALVGNKVMVKNVLAFPASKEMPRPDVKGKKALGEIYLNPAYIRSYGEDLQYMLIHGVLHLLGYDHKKKSDRIRMEKKEHDLYYRIRHRLSND